MLTFTPTLRLAALLAPQSGLEDKFGGLPWGLPPGRWPRCAHCGDPLSLLAQLRHHPRRLPLGREGRVLHVFQCADWANAGCHPFEWDSGANACFVLEPEALRAGAGLSPPPGQIGRADDPWAWRGHVAVRALAWTEKEDVLPAEHHDTYFDPNRWFYVPDEIRHAIATGTKLGGVPAWGNFGPGDHPPEPWRLAVQLQDDLDFPVPMPDGLTERVDESGERLIAWPSDDGSRWGCRWTNFAGGVGHVYLNDGDPPAGRFTWQRW